MTHIGLALSAGAQHSDNPDILQAQAQGMLQGIQKYQMHPFKRPDRAHNIVWQDGQVKLLHLQGNKTKDAIFIIPSMINRGYILDLLEGHSFCAWLAGQGHDVYLLDWGEPTEDDGQSSMDVLFDQRIFSALDACCAQAWGSVHVLGYCMGGTLAAALAQLKPDQVKTLCLLAAPWDFKGGGGDLGAWVQFWMPAGLAMIVQYGYLPADWIQNVFASLDPFHTAEKFSAFAQMDEDDPKAPVFVAVEDWLNDAVPLPGELARECLVGWFTNNAPHDGKWEILGQRISPSEISAPVLIVSSDKDRLVPQASSLAFGEHIKADYIKTSSGHIGFMVSQSAQDDVWAQIAAFYSDAS